MRALVFAQPIASIRMVTKTYPVAGFEDTEYRPTADAALDLTLPADARWTGFGFAPVPVSSAASDRPFDAPTVVLRGRMLRADGTPAPMDLVPLGSAPLLRRVTFPIGGPIR